MVLQPIFPRAIWAYSVTGTLLSVLSCWSVSASCRMVLGYLFGWAGTSGYGSGTTAEQIARDYSDRIKDKTFVVTGCSSGIGKEAALRLAQQGGRVVMACRNKDKMSAAADDIRREVPDAKIDQLVLDLASMASIRQFASDLTALKLKGGVNCLINNAGVMACPLAYTTDGFEMQLGSNHLGHFLLTNLLADELKKGQPSRVVNLSSAAHSMAYAPEGIRLDDLEGKQHYTEWNSYGQSKLANLLHAYELDKRFKSKGLDISAHSVHPGVIKTELDRHLTNPLAATMFGVIAGAVGKSIPQGAATTLYCALSPQLDAAAGGRYYADCNELAPQHPAINSPEGLAGLAEKLWEASAKLTKSDLP